jgi:hypothetical protein
MGRSNPIIVLCSMEMGVIFAGLDVSAYQLTNNILLIWELFELTAFASSLTPNVQSQWYSQQLRPIIAKSFDSR